MTNSKTQGPKYNQIQKSATKSISCQENNLEIVESTISW